MLVVQNVTAGYTAVPGLLDVSLHADTGETIAILGANGAGKTTLLRLISGLIPLRSGSVLLDGVPIHLLPTQKIARLGVTQVIEARGVLPNLTVEENIVLGLLGSRGRTKARRADAVDKASTLFPWIGDRLTSYGHELSGGQQQMVAICRALATEPKLLLLDEPSLGIAPALVEEIYSKIELMSGAERTIVIVEQNVTKVLAVAQRAYVMRRGQVVLEGASKKLAGSAELTKAYFS